MRSVLATLLCCFLIGCGGGGGSDSSDKDPDPPIPPAPGDWPYLSVSYSPYSEPPPASEAEAARRIDEAASAVRQAGANAQFHAITWSDLEPALGFIDQEAFDRFVENIRSGAANGDVQLVGLQVINTQFRTVPVGLQAAAWDDPAMIQAFRNLLDRLVPEVQGGAGYLSIGNEVDVYFGNGRIGELNAYKTFVARAREYLASRLPGAQVGTTITSGAWLGPQVQTWLDLTADHDVVITTYYPLDPDFTVRPPQSVAAELPALLAVAPNQPWVFQEVGYPSSGLCESSEALQAEFVREFFAALRRTENRIPFANWFLLHDFSEELVDLVVSSVGISDPRFRGYIESLGLRNRDNTDKQAWPVLQQEIADF